MCGADNNQGYKLHSQSSDNNRCVESPLQRGLLGEPIRIRSDSFFTRKDDKSARLYAIRIGT